MPEAKHEPNKAAILFANMMSSALDSGILTHKELLESIGPEEFAKHLPHYAWNAIHQAMMNANAAPRQDLAPVVAGPKAVPGNLAFLGETLKLALDMEVVTHKFVLEHTDTFALIAGFSKPIWHMIQSRMADGGLAPSPDPAAKTGGTGKPPDKVDEGWPSDDET